MGHHGIITGSTKTYTHSIGLSCCFRQWRAKSHCNQLHGYALQVEVQFEAYNVDDKNWVVDFGGLKEFKKWLEEMFDHTTIVAMDDPYASMFEELEQKGVANIKWVKATGCEAFSLMIFEWLENWLRETPGYNTRVTVQKVEVREHASNSGYTRVD